MIVLAAIGGFTILLALADLTDFLLVRAGKRSVLHRRPALPRDIPGPFGAAQNDPARHPHDFTG